RPVDGGPGNATPAEIESLWEQGRQALTKCDFAQAASELGTARTLLDRQPDLLSPVRKRLLLNQQREAALLAEWAADGAKQPEQLFKRDNDPDLLLRGYRGHVLVFDTDVRRDPRDQYHVEHRRPTVGELIRLDLQNFKLLHRLPLMEPQRLIFAGRLADARR